MSRDDRDLGHSLCSFVSFVVKAFVFPISADVARSRRTSPMLPISRLPDYPIFNLAGRVSVGGVAFAFQFPDYPIFNLAGRVSVVGVAFAFQFPDYPITRCVPPVHPKI
jgi:hypothetical protein